MIIKDDTDISSLPSVEYMQVCLEPLPTVVTRCLSLRNLKGAIGDNAKVKLFLDITQESLVMQLITYIWSNKLNDIEIKYPETWWDAFKLRWFPSWLLQRYPIIYTTHCIKIYESYPNQVGHKLGDSIRMIVHTEKF